MKNLIKTIMVVVIAGVLMSGCAIKDTDSTFNKTLKHTANAPLYASIVIVHGTLLTVAGTAKVVKSTVNAVAGDNKRKN